MTVLITNKKMCQYSCNNLTCKLPMICKKLKRWNCRQTTLILVTRSKMLEHKLWLSLVDKASKRRLDLVRILASPTLWPIRWEKSICAEPLQQDLMTSILQAWKKVVYNLKLSIRKCKWTNLKDFSTSAALALPWFRQMGDKLWIRLNRCSRAKVHRGCETTAPGTWTPSSMLQISTLKWWTALWIPSLEILTFRTYLWKILQMFRQFQIELQVRQICSQGYIIDNEMRFYFF